MKVRWSHVGQMKLPACAFAFAVFALAPRAMAADRLALPAAGSYLGIWANPGLCSNGSENCAILMREQQMDLTFALHLHYYQWSDISDQYVNGMFPDSDLVGDITSKRIPVITWGCDDNTDNSDQVIAQGDYSDVDSPIYCIDNPTFCDEAEIIYDTASALARYPGPVLLRWFWEFNVLDKNQNCRGVGVKPPEVHSNFIGAWQQIWTIFQQAGATNVMFLWNPSNAKNPEYLQKFYPGPEYVDWIGVDTYQTSTTDTFTSNFAPFYSFFSQFGKPLIVGENGSQNYSENNEELQSFYLDSLYGDVLFTENVFPQLKAYDYFDATGKRGDWILDDGKGKQIGGLQELAILGKTQEFNPVLQTCSVSLNSTTNTVPYPQGGDVKINVVTTANCPWSVGPLPSTPAWIAPGTVQSQNQSQNVGPLGPGTVTLHAKPTQPGLSYPLEIGGAFITIHVQP